MRGHGIGNAVPADRAPDDLPLRSRTPRAWAERALEDPLRLLDDHAHLERKAAWNALALFHRWPVEGDAEGGAAWARTLAGIARDETEHLALVLRHLTRRGGAVSRGHANPYAAALHRLVRAGAGTEELVDRLLVAALIEARSCERFLVLAEAAADEDLRALYRGLCASERGHFRAFLALAEGLPGVVGLDARWAQLLDEEARILEQQRPAARMHGGA
jgi:tRNA-(ms[2]io[6]A)-hydroxylase